MLRKSLTQVSSSAAFLVAFAVPTLLAHTNHGACRPAGVYKSPGVNVPYYVADDRAVAPAPSVVGRARGRGYYVSNFARVPGWLSSTLTYGHPPINPRAHSPVAFVRQYGFGGVDIDCEYAASLNDAGNPLDW